MIIDLQNITPKNATDELLTAIAERLELVADRLADLNEGNKEVVAGLEQRLKSMDGELEGIAHAIGRIE